MWPDLLAAFVRTGGGGREMQDRGRPARSGAQGGGWAAAGRRAVGWQERRRASASATRELGSRRGKGAAAAESEREWVKGVTG